MGIFRHSPDISHLATKAELSQVVARLDRELADLKRDMKQIDEEWSTVYDKYRTLLARLTKRAKDAKRGDDGENDHPPETPTYNPVALRLLESARR